MQIWQNAKILNINNPKPPYSRPPPLAHWFSIGTPSILFLLYFGLFIFGIFAFCYICILSHLRFVTIALCLICILLHLQFVTFAFCYICIMSRLHFVWFAFYLFLTFCYICILSNLHFVMDSSHGMCTSLLFLGEGVGKRVSKEHPESKLDLDLGLVKTHLTGIDIRLLGLTKQVYPQNIDHRSSSGQSLVVMRLFFFHFWIFIR